MINVSIVIIKVSMIITKVYCLQHATDNVAKLILGNKCDMEARRVVPTEQGEQVGPLINYLT